MKTNDEIEDFVRIFVRDIGVATLTANAAQRAYTVGSAEKSLRNDTERFTQALLGLKDKWERAARLDEITTYKKNTGLNYFDDKQFMEERITELTQESK